MMTINQLPTKMHEILCAFWKSLRVSHVCRPLTEIRFDDMMNRMSTIIYFISHTANLYLPAHFFVEPLLLTHVARCVHESSLSGRTF